MSEKPSAALWWNIRAGNGDLLDRIKAETEQQAFEIFYAMEERRTATKPSPHVPDGRTLLGTVH